MNRRWFVAMVTGAVALGLGPPGGAAAEPDPGSGSVLSGPVVVPLEEVPAFGQEEAGGRVQYRYPRGQSVACLPTASSAVKAYPKLNSKRPLYGAVRFDAAPADPASGRTFHFVLDEAGDVDAAPRPDGDAGAKPAPAEGQKATPAEGQTAASGPAASQTDLLGKLAQGLTAKPAPANPFGAPRVVKQTYDLLYFDRNGDLDLTNDDVLRLTAKPVFEAMPAGQMRGLSGELELAFDFGPELGQRSVPLAVSVYAYQTARLGLILPNMPVPTTPAASPLSVTISFLPKTVRRGTFKLGDEQYVAWLSQATMITGRYDRPTTRLEVIRLDRSTGSGLLQPGTLGQVHWLGEQLASISTSPLGDKLTIEPYPGDTGVLELVSGGRAITDLGLTGTLLSSTGSTSLGGRLNVYGQALPRRYTLPVGDYAMPSLIAQYGRLRFNARIATGTPTTERPAFPIQIRKGERFALAFSGKAEVVFAGPPRDKSFRPGDKVDVRAMLTEPWQNLQITGLYDTTRKERETKYQIEGREVVVPQYARLDPTIAIKNAAGKTVAEGTMPFG